MGAMILDSFDIIANIGYFAKKKGVCYAQSLDLFSDCMFWPDFVYRLQYAGESQ
jgi:hypothetical protein